MVRISLFGLSVLPLRRTLAETTRAVRPLLLFVAVIVAITYTTIMITGAKIHIFSEMAAIFPQIFISVWLSMSKNSFFFVHAVVARIAFRRGLTADGWVEGAVSCFKRLI